MIKSEARARGKAYAALRRAVASGKAQRPSSCELCGRGCKHVRITGHHFKGYDHPLDVWWICQRCNRALVHKHDNSLTFAEAQKIAVGETLTGYCGECRKEKAQNTTILVRYRG